MVHFYMPHIMAKARHAVNIMLVEFHQVQSTIFGPVAVTGAKPSISSAEHVINVSLHRALLQLFRHQFELAHQMGPWLVAKMPLLLLISQGQYWYPIVGCRFSCPPVNSVASSVATSAYLANESHSALHQNINVC